METLLKVFVVIFGIPVGAVIGQKIMIAFNIPTRIDAAAKGKTLWWDITLIVCIAGVIALGITGVNWLFDGDAETPGGLPAPAIVSWLFAAWWLLVAVRDFNVPRYRSDAGTSRYREPVPLILALAASIALGLVGLFIVIEQRILVIIALLVFAVSWAAWTAVAREGHDKGSYV
jgi:hypothetical protein